MTGFLRGKTVVITGGFGALGQALNDATASAGARTALLDKTPLPYGLADTADMFGGIDLSLENIAVTTLKKIAGNAQIDILINAAGSFVWSKIADADSALWLDLYKSNVLSAANAIKATLPHMSKSGLILNVAAAAALRASVGMAPYTAAKSGVLRLTEALAEELGDSNIRVYSVSPSVLDTPRNRLDIPNEYPKRWITPQKLAASMLALWDSSAPSGKDFRI